MPESVTASGAKATKGEYGFRYGASIPRPMLMAFNKARARTHTHTHTHTHLTSKGTKHTLSLPPARAHTHTVSQPP